MSEELFDEDFMDGPEEMDLDEVEEEAAISFTQDDANADPAKLGLTDAQRKRWSRPAVPAAALDPSQSTLNMQWLDIDMIGGQPLPANPNPSKRKMVGARAGQVPVIRIFGVTDAGNSVAAYIHGYTPYGYFGLPDGYEVDGSEENLAEIRRFLNDRLREKVGGRGRGGGGGNAGGANGNDDAAASAFCHGVQYIDDHSSIMGYSATHTKFLKVFVGMPTMIPKLKTIMESEGHNVPGLRSTNGGGGMGCQLQPFECNVPFVLRFMIDRDITGAGWLTLPEGTYSLRRNEAQKQTHCQLEVDVAFNEIVAHKPEGEWNKIAPLRVLSLDIECQGRKGHFPEAEQDPVIQIANAVSVYGNNDGPIVQNVFTLKGCLPIVGAQVIPSDTEEDMLLKWRAFLQAADADIITGYNVQVSLVIVHCGMGLESVLAMAHYSSVQFVYVYQFTHIMFTYHLLSLEFRYSLPPGSC